MQFQGINLENRQAKKRTQRGIWVAVASPDTNRPTYPRRKPQALQWISSNPLQRLFDADLGRDLGD
jgi:hypothetical protein